MEDDQVADDFAEGFEGTASAPTEKPDPEAVVVAEPEAPRLAQITEDQYQQLLAKATAIDEIKAAQEKQFGTAFGKIGGIERVINQLQAATQSGEVVEISEDDFEEMRAEFPELAAMQVRGLNKVLSKLRGTGQAPAQFDPSQIDGRVQEQLSPALQDIERRYETKLLRAYHRDWDEVVTSDAFKEWEKTLPAEDQAKLASSTDAEYIASQLDRYKSAAKTISSRQKRIEAAITPRGTGGHAPAPSEDDDFNAGFSG